MSYSVEIKEQNMHMVEEGQVPPKTVIRAYLTSQKNQLGSAGSGRKISMKSDKGRILIAKDVLKPQVIQSLGSNISLHNDSLLFLSSYKQSKKK